MIIVQKEMKNAFYFHHNALFVQCWICKFQISKMAHFNSVFSSNSSINNLVLLDIVIVTEVSGHYRLNAFH